MGVLREFVHAGITGGTQRFVSGNICLEGLNRPRVLLSTYAYQVDADQPKLRAISFNRGALPNEAVIRREIRQIQFIHIDNIKLSGNNFSEFLFSVPPNTKESSQKSSVPEQSGRRISSPRLERRTLEFHTYI